MAGSPTVVVKLSDLAHDQVAICFAVLLKKERFTGKDQKPYVKCRFRDKRVELASMIWSNHPLHADCHHWAEGAAFRLKVQGDRNSSFGMQIKIQEARLAEDRDIDDGYDYADLLEWSDRRPQELYEKLLELIEQGIADSFLKTLVLSILGENQELLLKMPAATKFHHGYNGGLLEHIWSMARVGVFLSKHYANYYSKLDPPFNKSLVVAGTILHDIGKLRELEYHPVEAKYSKAGSLLGHIVMGRDMIREAAAAIEGFPEETLLLLEHAVLAHHGKKEYGSPVIPLTIEALLLSYIDDLDAKMNQAARVLLNTPDENEFTERIYALDNRSFYRGSRRAEQNRDPTEPSSE